MTYLIIAVFDMGIKWIMAILSSNSLSRLFEDPLNTIGSILTTVVDFLRQVDFIVPIPTIFQIFVLNTSLSVLLVIIWFFNKGLNLLADVIP